MVEKIIGGQKFFIPTYSLMYIDDTEGRWSWLKTP